MIVETVQAEGGVNVASTEWLRALADMCRQHEVLLIVDDIQAGCGRTGPFFSFEDAGIVPDMICLSKSIGGYGLPLALTLVRPELDVWRPGAHSGTFRGVNPAFITAAAALSTYWRDDALEKSTRARGEWIANALQDIVQAHPGLGLSTRGRGLIQGLVVGEEWPTRWPTRRSTGVCWWRPPVLGTRWSSCCLRLRPPTPISPKGSRSLSSPCAWQLNGPAEHHDGRPIVRPSVIRDRSRL